MVLLSSKKRMVLHPLELVIRRCPVCLKDTEQDAFYAERPDFSTEAMTPTTPQFKVMVSPADSHGTNWSIVSRCRECGYLYKVTGIQQYRMKEIKAGVKQDVMTAIFCCDICYNEEARYEPAEIFIRLSEGKSVYLCEKHAADAEREKSKTGSYASLINRFNVWRINDAMPKAVQLGDGTVVAFIGDRGYMEQILVDLAKSGESKVQDLARRIMEKSPVHRTQGLIEEQVKDLARLSLVEERGVGSVLKSRHVRLTAKGMLVAGMLGSAP